MSRIRVLPYKTGSRSAKALATALGGKVLKLEGSTYCYRPTDLLINWGSSDTGFHTGILNLGFMVRDVSNKLNFFNRMKARELDDIIPPFWTDPEDIPDSEFPVVCRTILTGHSGAGIHMASTRADLVVAPLYVQYVKKKEEYRVHVGNRNSECVTIAVQRKARRLSVPDDEVDWQVRNLAGGFVYTRDGFTVPESVVQAAHRALQAVSLDFGAVDVIWNAQQEKAYVLEINSAPGLSGTTITDYRDFFHSRMG